MKTYEVTIPFKPGPWYTGYAMAEDKTEAIVKVWQSAVSQGFKGKPGKAQVLVVQ